ncbi:ras guanine nucleotide exchange factor domain-containing protein [Parasitella parasitica]|nr:ras guanine nucleotide exchange factor domain-containing protein [Parasitella parasitica]
MSEVPILCKVQALYPFKSNDSSSLSFSQDDLIDVLNKLPSGWWDGLCNGTRGWFPSNYVRVIASDKERMEIPVKTKSEYRLSMSYNDTADTQHIDNSLMPQQKNGNEPNVNLLNKRSSRMSESTIAVDSAYDFDHETTAGMPSWSHQSTLLVSEEKPQLSSRYSSNQSLNSLKIDSAPSSPQLLPRSPSRGPSTHEIHSDEPLSWNRISSNVAIAIHQLTVVVKRNQCSLYHECSVNVVDSIRFMLIASSTIDKDSGYIKSNGTLRSHHRAMMASMTKLVLSIQTSHAFLSTGGDDQQIRAGKISSESNELLLMVRNFVNACQSLEIPLVHIDPRWIDEKDKNCMLGSSRNSSFSSRSSKHLSNHSNRYSLQVNLAENLETMGACIQDSAEMIIKCISTLSLQKDRVALAESLFTHFRNLSNQASLLLGYIDETDFTVVQQQSEMSNLQSGKQTLVQRLGLLFYKLQALTDKSTVDFLACSRETELVASSLFEPIKLICESVLCLASKYRSRTNSNASYSVFDNSDPTKKAPSSAGKDEAVLHEVDEEQGIESDELTLEEKHGFKPSRSKIAEEDGKGPAMEIMERHKSELIPKAPMLTYPMQRSQTAPAARQISSNKLKRFFGDETPLPKSTAAKPTPRERPDYLLYNYGPKEIVFNEQGGVKGGTLPALVERLTLHDFLDMNFINTFLLTYRSFCTSMDLLDLLEARYNLQCPPGLSKEDVFIWEEKKLKLVRLRVFNVLKNWLETYYNEDDSALLDRLLEFTHSNIKNTLRFSNGQLESLIQRRRKAETMDGHKKMILTLPDPPVPILPKNRYRFKLLDIDSLEMARQLTIMDFRLYSAIRPIECLDKAWSRDEGGNIAVNIRSSIEYCNQITCWVSDVILSQHDIKKRSVLIKYWVQVAEKCRVLNNFNTCMAILSAFDNSSVGRLQRTWDVVGTRTSQILQQIRKLMGANRNFIEYRDLIHSINPPCIPFLGIYLQDLTFIEDGNANELKKSKDLINFAKRAKTAEVIREIQQYQSSLYQLKPVNEIQDFVKINLQSTRDEEQLYKESLRLEPRIDYRNANQ